MTRTRPTNSRILSISPSTEGFGFAVLERGEKLVDWGVKHVSRDKNEESLRKVEELIASYLPTQLVVEDCLVKECRRSPRIRTLIQEIVKLAEQKMVSVISFPRAKVKAFLCPGGSFTKHDVAEVLAKRFPEELGLRLPPKRRPWKSEDSRMDIFDAVALALAVFS